MFLFYIPTFCFLFSLHPFFTFFFKILFLFPFLFAFIFLEFPFFVSLSKSSSCFKKNIISGLSGLFYLAKPMYVALKKIKAKKNGFRG